MDGLIKKGQEVLDCIEDTPYNEDGYTKGGENPVRPERRRDDDFVAKPLLSADIEDKCGNKGNGNGEERDRSWFQEPGTTTCKDREHIREHAEGGTEKQAANPIDLALQSLQNRRERLGFGDRIRRDTKDRDKEDHKGQDSPDVVSKSPTNTLDEDATKYKPNGVSNRLASAKTSKCSVAPRANWNVPRDNKDRGREA